MRARTQNENCGRGRPRSREKRVPYHTLGIVAGSVILLLTSLLSAADQPKVAVFPLGGDAEASVRERAAFSFRAKLDRMGIFEVIDGPRMADLVAESETKIAFDTPAERVKELGKDVDAAILIWGEISGGALRVNFFDGRDGRSQRLTKPFKQPTDLRFAVEQVLEQLPGVKPFEHMSEEPVQRDSQAEQLWKTNPNLLSNGTFDTAQGWEGIYRDARWPVKIAARPPEPDDVAIVREGDGNVLAMNLSQECATTNGLACLSAAVKIEANTRYRLTFRFRSTGPNVLVFVKGYTLAPDINGKLVEREIYRRQVPEQKDRSGQWITVETDLNPQHPAYPVQSLRVDLYAYLREGIVMFDDVALKAVGAPTRRAADDAIKKPVTRSGRQ